MAKTNRAVKDLDQAFKAYGGKRKFAEAFSYDDLKQLERWKQFNVPPGTACTFDYLLDGDIESLRGNDLRRHVAKATAKTSITPSRFMAGPGSLQSHSNTRPQSS